MEKSETTVGMRVRIVKADSSRNEGWAPSDSKSYIGKIATISEIHSSYDALNLCINLKGVDTYWWFHCKDVIPYVREKIKKQKFDLKNLVVGV